MPIEFSRVDQLVLEIGSRLQSQPKYEGATAKLLIKVLKSKIYIASSNHPLIAACYSISEKIFAEMPQFSGITIDFFFSDTGYHYGVAPVQSQAGLDWMQKTLSRFERSENKA